ncbi:MAG TPA: proton-conducting transporter membrane subunit, partial [bacterium]|nr:proton-conducting transporter membrane subunit [bacterium]
MGSVSATDMLSILPELILFGMGMVVILLDLYGRGRGTGYLAVLSLLSLVVAAYSEVTLLGHGLTGFGGEVAADDYAIAFGLIFMLVTAFTVLMSFRFLDYQGPQRGEYYALLLFACAGMQLMAAGLDLLMIFVGLEILSISSYILCGIIQKDLKSNESALKYFLLGA